MESTKKRNLPKIEVIKREKKEIEQEIMKIKQELWEMNEIKPVVREPNCIILYKSLCV